MTKRIDKFNWVNITFFVFVGFLFSWFERERITTFLFLGKRFEGRTIFLQVLLLIVYASSFVLLLFLVARHKNFLIVPLTVVLLVYPLQYVVNFLSFPYPLEYREAVSIHPALAIARGINPYSLPNFPEYTYLYGALFPLTLAPFVSFSSHPLLVTRAYVVLFMAAFCVLAFWVFRKRNASIMSALIGVLILINSMCYIWIINGARPDAPALFFAFLGFYFLLGRNFDNLSVVLCAISCVISFHFKQYFLFSTLVITAFLFLFVAKQKAYLFIVAAVGLGLTSFIVFRYFFPLYYEYSIWHHIVLSEVSRSSSHMGEQVVSFLGYYWIIIILYFLHIYKLFSTTDLKRIREIRFSLLRVKEPFIRHISMDIFDVGLLFSVIILTFWLGRHGGNSYTYYGELLLPFLLFVTIPRIDKLFEDDWHRSVIQCLILAFCVFPFCYKHLQQDFSLWRESYSTFSKYVGKCQNIYDQTPLASIYKIENNLYPIYNNGQTEYAPTVIPNRETIAESISMIPGKLLEQRLVEWDNELTSKIESKKFDCIVTDSRDSFEGYEEVKKIPSVLQWTLYIYEKAP